MQIKSNMKIIIIDESIVELSMLMGLLSPLTRNMTVCLGYHQGAKVLDDAEIRKSPYDLVFLSLPSNSHEDIDDAVKCLALSLRSGDPLQTILLSGNKLPEEFTGSDSRDSSVLAKPITLEKLQDILAPLEITIPHLNCWEYMGCGREEGGKHAAEMGVCAAAKELGAQGIHGGEKGGRCCWAISGTLCGNITQGTFAKKIANCMNCDFYRLVNMEEGDRFESITSTLKRIDRNK